MGYVAHELDLSDTQKAQIKSIWEGERPNISELVHEFASEQKEMDALTFQGGAPTTEGFRTLPRARVRMAKLFCGEGKAYVQDLFSGSESCATHQSG